MSYLPEVAELIRVMRSGTPSLLTHTMPSRVPYLGEAETDLQEDKIEHTVPAFWSVFSKKGKVQVTSGWPHN